MFEGLRKPKTLIVIVVTLLAYGCPTQAVVQAFGLDERTVASWRNRAGKHCQQVHRALVQLGAMKVARPVWRGPIEKGTAKLPRRLATRRL